MDGAESGYDPSMDPASPDQEQPLDPAITDDEPELVARVQRGDAGAFDVLVRRYLRRSGAIAYRLLGNREDAEDLVQDAFIRALDRIDTFEAGRSFGPWFFRILVNTGLNARRSRSLRLMDDEPADLRSDDPLPDELAERQEVRDRFTAALAALPERQRLIVSMFEVDGFTSAEIAETLGITQETVRWHVHQARRALRATLAPVRD